MAGTSVLFVDDDAHASYGYTELLRIDGWSAASAELGSDAVSAVRCLRPTMVVVHLWVPEPRGFETVRRLAQLRRAPALIVGLTGAAGQSLARAAGCDAAILKPVEPLSFVEATRQLYRAFLGVVPERVGRLRQVVSMEDPDADRGLVHLFRSPRAPLGVDVPRRLH